MDHTRSVVFPRLSMDPLRGWGMALSHRGAAGSKEGGIVGKDRSKVWKGEMAGGEKNTGYSFQTLT